MYLKFQLIWLINIIAFSVHAQDVKIDSYVEKDTALIGEQILFSIEVQSNTPLNSFIPLDENLFPGQIEIISQDIDSVKENSVSKYLQNYTITCFDSGSYVIGPIPVLINDHSQLDTLFTEKQNLIIQLPEVDTSAAIRDIKPPINTPFQVGELLPYVPYIGGILILLAVFLLLFYFARRKKKIQEVKMELPPHIKALRSLDRLKAEKLWQKGETKEYYIQLSSTIRIYIEEQYGIPAMESVTWEIINDFKRRAWDDESLLELLESLLQLSDLVKFAKEDPAPSDNETNLNNAYIFIEKTKPDLTPSEKTEEKV